MKLNNPNKFQYWPHDGFLQWFNKRDLAVAILFNGSKTLERIDVQKRLTVQYLDHIYGYFFIT